MSLVINLKQAIKGIDTLLKNQWYNDHKDFVELKYKLSKRLEEAEELIASVNGHDTEELDFEHFAKMFKSLV